jgi:WD40 repeat protein/tetratricopeptide (TPR) repeat protein
MSALSPFRSIHPFGYRDRSLFFGRAGIVQEMLVKVMLSRLVVFFGESGTGKSSLLNAGLVPELQKEGYMPHRLSIEPGGPIMVEAIEGDEAGTYLPSIFPAPATAKPDGVSRTTCSLAEFEQRVRKFSREARPVLIFDQFEQLFTLFDRSKQGEREDILRTIQDLIDDDGLQVKVVIAIREDFVGNLEVLAEAYPRVFDNRIRLQQLDADSALEAILKPFEQPGRFPSCIDEKLAELIVKELSEEGASDLVHPTKLQIICSSLWDKHSGKPKIIVDHYVGMDSCAGILSGYLKGELNKLDSKRRTDLVRVLGSLVTDAGTRDIVSSGKLKELLVDHKKMDADALQVALTFLRDQKLVNATPRKETAYYEIASEYLIPPIQQELDILRLKEMGEELDRLKQQQREQQRVEDQLRQRRLLILLAAGLVVALFGAFSQWQKAEATATDLAKETEKANELRIIADEKTQLAEEKTQLAEEKTQLAEEKTKSATESERRARDAAALESKARKRAEEAEKLAAVEKELHLASSLRSRASSAFQSDPQVALHLALASLRTLDGLPSKDASLGGGRLEAEQAVRSALQATTALPGSGVHVTEVSRFSSEVAAPDKVTVSRDGKLIAMVAGCGEVSVWSARLGVRIADIPCSRLEVLKVGFAGDSQRAGGSQRLLIVKSQGWEVWDLESNRRVLTSDEDKDKEKEAKKNSREPDKQKTEPNRVVVQPKVALSNDGRYLARVEENGVNIEDLEGKRDVRRLKFDGPRSVSELAVNSAGDLVAVGFADGSVDLLSASGEPAARVLRNSPLMLAALSFVPGQPGSPENLAVLNKDGLFRYVIPQTGKTLWMASHRGAQRFLSDGAGALATIAADGEAILWHERTGDRIRSDKYDGQPIGWWPADSGVGRQAAFLTSRSQIVVKEFLAGSYPRNVLAFALSPDGRKLAVASQNNMVEVYSTRLGRRLAQFAPGQGRVTTLAFSPNGRQLAIADQSGAVTVVRSTTGQQIAALPSQNAKDSILRIAYAPDGTRLIAANDCGGIAVWDLRTSAALDPFPKQSCDDIFALEVSADGKSVVTGSRAGVVTVHDFQSRRVVGAFGPGRMAISGLVLDRQLGWIAALTFGGLVEVWVPQSGQWRKQAQLDRGDRAEAPVYAIAATSVDGQLAMIDRKGVVAAWDVSGSKPPTTIAVGLATGRLAAFGPGGAAVVVAPANDSLRFYPLNSTELVSNSLLRLERALSESECEGYLLSQRRSCGAFEISNGAAAGNALAAKGDYESALQRYKQTQSARRDGPAGFEAYAREGLVEMLVADAWMHMRSKDRVAAQDALKRAKAIQLGAVDDPAKTESEWSQVLDSQARSTRVGYLVNRGDTLARRSGNVEAAVVQYQRALQIDPQAIAERPQSRASMRSALFYVGQAERFARIRQRDKTLQSLQQALGLDASALGGKSPERFTAELFAPFDIEQSLSLFREGHAVEGIKLFATAWKVAPVSSVSSSTLNELCWYGALTGHAAEVVDTACENAFLRTSAANVADSRGVARALVGRRELAIEDFVRFIEDLKQPEQLRAQRKQWVDVLKTGGNPFTGDVLRALIDE